MTQYVKILNEGVRPPDEKQVVALLYDDTIPETRRVIVNTQAGFDAHSHILTHFNVFWSFGVLVSDGWANETEREDIREHAQEAIISINQGISVLNSNPSSAQVIAVVRALLIIVRKLIRYIAG